MTDGSNSSRDRGKHSGRTQRFITHDHGNAKILEFRGKVQRLEKMSASIHNVH